MKVLITSSRMPFALGMVRKLAGEGRESYAADDHFLSPGEPLPIRSTSPIISFIRRCGATRRDFSPNSSGSSASTRST